MATVLAGAWMLDYLGQKKASEAIFAATLKAIAEKKALTYDLGGNAKQSEMVDAIIKKFIGPLITKLFFYFHFINKLFISLRKYDNKIHFHLWV